jgi:hypothetical protein
MERFCFGESGVLTPWCFLTAAAPCIVCAACCIGWTLLRMDREEERRAPAEVAMVVLAAPAARQAEEPAACVP